MKWRATTCCGRVSSPNTTATWPAALAYVMTGGNLPARALVHEDYLLELEREVFLSLLGEKKTQERIASILQRNKPLRN